jgi:hypothetical protein
MINKLINFNCNIDGKMQTALTALFVVHVCMHYPKEDVLKTVFAET